MTRKEDSTLLGAERNTKTELPIKPAVEPQKRAIIDNWLSQFEERIARDFYRRTGLDYQTTIAQIVEAAEPFPGMQILDVPTGSGIIARQFVGKIGQEGKIIGADTTREKLEEARLAAQSAKASLRIEWRLMQGEKFNAENNKFDLVTSAMAFHRMNGEKFLSEAYRVLKPGGRLLIADELAPEVGTSSLRESVRRKYFLFIARNRPEAEAHFYSTEEMMQLVKDAGFSQVLCRALRQRDKHDRIFTLVKAVK